MSSTIFHTLFRAFNTIFRASKFKFLVVSACQSTRITRPAQSVQETSPFSNSLSLTGYSIMGPFAIYKDSNSSPHDECRMSDLQRAPLYCINREVTHEKICSCNMCEFNNWILEELKVNRDRLQ